MCCAHFYWFIIVERYFLRRVPQDCHQSSYLVPLPQRVAQEWEEVMALPRDLIVVRQCRLDMFFILSVHEQVLFTIVCYGYLLIIWLGVAYRVMEF